MGADAAMEANGRWTIIDQPTQTVFQSRVGAPSIPSTGIHAGQANLAPARRGKILADSAPPSPIK